MSLQFHCSTKVDGVQLRTSATILKAWIAAALLVSCASHPPPVKTPSDAKVAPEVSTASTAERVRAWRAWEPSGLRTFHVELPDGLMTADVDAKEQPKVECKNGEDEMRVCSLVIELGKDDEGTPRTLGCAAASASAPLPFGVLVSRALGKMRLDELPRVEVAWGKGSGGDGSLVARFDADGSYETDDQSNTMYGSAKIAARYAPGHTFFCGDTSTGQRKATERLTTQLFESVKIKGIPERVVQQAYVERRGQTAAGFRFGFVRKADEGGFFEVESQFRVESTDTTWEVRDYTTSVTRDAKGVVETVRRVGAVGGEYVSVLTAKPGEAGRLRVKLEAGGKSDALEITPRVALSTELWESPSLLRVAGGRAPKHRYAYVTTRDGEPTLGYANLTRVRPGMVQEEIEIQGVKVKDQAKQQRNELSLDERGFVTKQVSSDSVYERIHLSGSLPNLLPSKKP
ncbi:MAG: hypothetical protein HOO96_40225 [Polyangiaceae bacterium]|nr:hypothetical protein [Polyangiaceae bacterium]